MKERAGTSVKFKLYGVKAAFITVDMSANFASHYPIFIGTISLLQIGFFVYWVCAVSGVGSLSLRSPVSGPDWSWLLVISDFPSCYSVNDEIWRYVTYQFVHAGKPKFDPSFSFSFIKISLSQKSSPFFVSAVSLSVFLF